MLTTPTQPECQRYVWLTLPFYDFCGFRSVAVNTAYKLQFFTFIFVVLLPVLSRLLIMSINTTFFRFFKMAAVRHLRFLKVRNTVNPRINAESQLNAGSPINDGP